MAIRSTIHVLKNTQTSNKALPDSGIQMGEPLVNLFNGILLFSGVTGGDYTPFVDSSNTTSGGTYFEVGSNVYNLQIRNRITSYNGVNGSGLENKYLKGTSNGFVLEDVTNIGSITGFTYEPSTNIITILQSNGTNLSQALSAFTGINLYGSNNVSGDLTVTGNTTLQGTAVYNIVTNGSNPLEIVNFSSLSGYVQTNDVYVTGNTLTAANNNTATQAAYLEYHGVPIGGPYAIVTENTFVTGGTYNGGTITFTYNDSTKSPFTVTGIDGTDTYVTGFTYNATSNKITLSQNQGKPDKNIFIDSVSGLTVSNLTTGQVVYAGSGGELKTDSTGEFAYNDSTNTLSIGTTSGNLIVNNGISDGPSFFGQGGLTVGSGGSHSSPGIGDLIVHGNFIVFGTGTTVATNELYVEDPQITLNYNPTGNTSPTSIASGIRIQDGSGTAGTDTYFTVSRLDTLTGLTGTQIPIVTEYTAGGVGNSNRGWLTQLNDIVIRNTNLNNGAPNGVRVLAEFDILDGGQY